MSYIKKVIFFMFVIFLSINAIYSQEEFVYPANFLLLKEMVLNKDYFSTQTDADVNCFNYFFNEENIFKKIQSDEKIQPQGETERQFKDKRNIFQILKSKLDINEIANFSGIFDQMNTPQKLAAAFSQGYLFDNDMDIYTKMDDRMKKDKFWQDYGASITAFGDVGTALIISGFLSLKGKQADKEAAQMIAEACIDLRNQFLKRLIGKTRPSDVVSSLGPNIVYDSFPSGHTDSAFALATVLGEVYSLKWLTYPAAFIVGLSRIQQNTHWPSDILAGALLGHLSARKVMYDHGYISKKNIAQSSFWDNTKVDIFTDYNLFFDTNQNFNNENPATDRVTSIILKTQVMQKMLPKGLFQISYHYRGQVPLILTYNSVQDLFIMPRFSYKISPKAALFVQYSDDKVDYNELGVAPYNRTSFPGDYSTQFRERKTTGGVIYKLTKELYMKPSYEIFNFDSSDFSNTYSRGRQAKIELGFVPEKKKPFSAFINYASGFAKTASSIYWQRKNSLYFEANHKFLKDGVITASFLSQRLEFPNYNTGSSSGFGNWKVYGIEYKRDFSPDWNIKLGYYRKTVEANILNWNYYKNVYGAQVNARF